MEANRSILALGHGLSSQIPVVPQLSVTMSFRGGIEQLSGVKLVAGEVALKVFGGFGLLNTGF